MPFTLSHAAAVVPIRRYGILSALVVGSFAPDMLYFIPHPAGSNTYSHTLPGLFFFCLPLGLAALWIFHAFLKRPLISLFPTAQQQRLLPIAAGFSFFPVSQFAKIIGSILLGAASHLTWDSFTHGDGWFVREVDFMRVRIVFTPHWQVSLFDFLQYGSTVFGLLVIAYYYFRWLRETPSTDATAHTHLSLSPAARLFLLLTFAAGAVAPAIARLWLNPEFRLHPGRTFLGTSAILGLKILTAEIVLFSVAWHFRRYWQQSESEQVSD